MESDRSTNFSQTLLIDPEHVIDMTSDFHFPLFPPPVDPLFEIFLTFIHVSSLLLYPRISPPTDNVDREALGELFNQYDSDKNGSITLDELETMLSHLGVGTYCTALYCPVLC